MAATNGNTAVLSLAEGDLVGKLLTTADIALSMHSDKLVHFERSLQNSGDESIDLDSIDEMRQANHSVEHAIDSATAEIIDACGDLLQEQQASLETYQMKTSDFDSKLDGIKQVGRLTLAVKTLLGMVRDLRAENEGVRNDVAEGKATIIKLLSRANTAEQNARTDPLTGLFNRRAFDEAYAKCEQWQTQDEKPFSLVMIDVDHFKHINDEYGHVAGDSVLTLLARVLRDRSGAQRLCLSIGWRRVCAAATRV